MSRKDGLLKCAAVVLLLVAFVAADSFAKRSRKPRKRWIRKATFDAVYDFGTDVPSTDDVNETRGKIYFPVASTTTNDDGTSTTIYSLWLSCGDGAEQVYEFDANQVVYGIANNKGDIYFIVQTTTTNDDGTTTVTEALWISDGTEDGTEEVHAFDSTQVVTTRLATNRGNLFFCITTTTTNDDGTTTVTDSLWVSDGTDDGTEAVYTFDTTELVFTGLIANKGNLYFGVTTTTTNDDGTSSIADSLWASDGTEDGTAPYYEFDNDVFVVSNMTATKGNLYFEVATITTNDDGTTTTTYSLWQSSGEGAEEVYTFDVDQRIATTITTTKGKLYFGVTTTVTNDDGTTTTTESLWVSDGTDAESVHDFDATQTFASDITTTKGKLFFIVNTTTANDDGTINITPSFWGSDGVDTEALGTDYTSNQTIFSLTNTRGIVFYVVKTTTTNDDGSITTTYELDTYTF